MAAAVGVSPGSFYSYFKDKRAVFMDSPYELEKLAITLNLT
nr:TetR/AcrR family transcriptional regulator [Paenibacillus selenitireducens]